MIHVSRDPESSNLAITITDESIDNFKILIDRALNCWPDAPGELKDLGDILTHGRVTQDHSYRKVGAAYTHSGEYSSAEQLAIKEIRENVGEEKYRELLLGDRVKLTELIKQQLR